MATTYFKPTSTFDKAAFDAAYAADTQAKSARNGEIARLKAQLEATPSWSPNYNARRSALINAQMSATPNTALPLARDQAGEAWDAAQGMTAGVSDSLMNDPRIEAALGRLQSGMESGPYSEAVQNQLISRNADASAYAEGVNADELRNQLAARGVGPNDPGYQAALRQMQSQRQAGNLAFAGDTRSNATLQNYGAQQDAARGLASAKLSQYGQAQPGYSQAANYQMGSKYPVGERRSFTGGSAPAPVPTVNNSAPNVAFSNNQSGQSTTPQPVGATTAANAVAKTKTSVPHDTAWYQARYGAGAQPGMSGTGRDEKGNLINPTPMAPATGGNYVNPKPAVSPYYEKNRQTFGITPLAFGG